jgi:hypothetical protein
MFIGALIATITGATTAGVVRASVCISAAAAAVIGIVATTDGNPNWKAPLSGAFFIS